MLYTSKSDFSKTLKSFARAFSKARRVEGQRPSWVLRATPLTSLAPKGGQSPPLITDVSNTRKLSGGQSPLL